MPLIGWNNTFSVGVQAMDAQHKNLIDIINQLHDAMRAGKASQELMTILDKMNKYTDEHFKSEEALLTANAYPKLSGQRASHIAFIQKTKELVAKNSEGKLAGSIEVSTFLKTWWTQHIQVDDKEYGVFLNAKGVK
jgi:hemerythrin